ncbi:ASKHA domain-containing protein [Heliobacterium mobile]|uniref:ASKHA domain-containing protein n=1 Tax=Heliobacterium mobile TaxID=28064 RepID=UPI002E26BC9B
MSTSVNVVFQPLNRTVQVEKGVTILQAARLAGVLIESPCNAVGTCGKCKVKLDQTSRSSIRPYGLHHLSPEEEEQGYVLSCEAEVLGDILVDVPSRSHGTELKILSHGQSVEVTPETYFQKRYEPKDDRTFVFAGDELVGLEQSNTEDQKYGLAVDIGTTTIVVSLVDLGSGQEIASASALNPQSLHAQDVLSRITFASTKRGLMMMYSELINELNRLIERVTEKSIVNREHIYEVIFSGNTCMIHLATGKDPAPLGKYPYIPEFTGAVHLSASEHHLGVSPFGLIYVPPVISAYVGADITSGILASQLHQQKGITLFVDIGTNGEMALAVEGKLSATSTAAGPAFEGMNITCGMRAGAGALEFFQIEDDKTITTKTIGDQEPVGICGSGLLDIVGELVANGVIDKNGRFVKPESTLLPASLKERLQLRDGKRVFQISRQVYLTQKDVRQVQLAKGAIRTGIDLLLRSKGITSDAVDRVLIAGSFGYHLRAKSLIHLGLLPDSFDGKIEFIGNTSKTGAQAFLMNQSLRKEMEKGVTEIEVIELANYGDFEQVFVRSLGF